MSLGVPGLDVACYFRIACLLSFVLGPPLKKSLSHVERPGDIICAYWDFLFLFAKNSVIFLPKKR